MKDHLDVIRALAEWSPPVHLFGGFAEDAVLHGRVTRRHEDVDVVVLRDDLPARIGQAKRMGFTRFRVRFEPVPGRPLVVGSLLGPLNLEFGVFDRAPDGRVYFDTPTPAGLTRVWLPPDALEGGERTLEGVPVRTLTPLALYQMRVGVSETFGGLRPKDRVSQAALRARFFADVPEGRLAPRIDLLDAAPGGGAAARA